MFRQASRFLTGVLSAIAVFAAARATAQPEPPEMPPLSWMRAGGSLESGYLHKPFTLDDDRAVRAVSISGSFGAGKVNLNLDPNQRTFNLFGDTVSVTEIARRNVMATLKPVKADDPMKKGRRLFEITDNCARN